MVEDRRQFGALQASVEHDQDGADQRHSKVGLQRQQAVARQYGDAIARHDACELQRRCERVHALLKLRVSEPPVAVDRAGTGAIDRGAARQKFQRRQDRFHDLSLI